MTNESRITPNSEPAERSEFEDRDHLVFPADIIRPRTPVEVFMAQEVPQTHVVEADLFARHDGIPAHDQERLHTARIGLIGGGGLNSWVAMGLARSGASMLTIIDGDRVDRTNLSRQFFHGDDRGRTKGIALARNISGQMVGGGTAVGVGLSFEDALETYPLSADILVVGVDNNECRLQAVREARRRRIPAVFSMLSHDGMRCHVFLQGRAPSDACLWCALPNLPLDDGMRPCVSAIISACFMAASFTVFFVHRALMGWGALPRFNWREGDLTGIAPHRTGLIKKRPDCPVCTGIKE